MADTNTVELGALLDAITNAIRAQYPDLQTVEFFREDRGGIPLPACLLDLPEWDNAPDDDDGTERLAVNVRFEAMFIMGFKEPNAKREIRKLAASFSSWLRKRRWPGIHTGPAEVLGATQDEFDPRLDQYEVWKVEWSQLVNLGASVWTNDGTIPTTVLVGFTPDIGVPHVADYVSVAP